MRNSVLGRGISKYITFLLIRFVGDPIFGGFPHLEDGHQLEDSHLDGRQTMGLLAAQ